MFFRGLDPLELTLEKEKISVDKVSTMYFLLEYLDFVTSIWYIKDMSDNIFQLLTEMY